MRKADVGEAGLTFDGTTVRLPLAFPDLTVGIGCRLYFLLPSGFRTLSAPTAVPDSASCTHFSQRVRDLVTKGNHSATRYHDPANSRSRVPSVNPDLAGAEACRHLVGQVALTVTTAGGAQYIVPRATDIFRVYRHCNDHPVSRPVSKRPILARDTRDGRSERSRLRARDLPERP